MRFFEFNIYNEDLSDNGSYQLPAQIKTPNEVADLQKVLTAFKFLKPEDINGVVDANTQRAIQYAQQLLNIAQTGTITPELIQEINYALIVTPEMGAIMSKLDSNLIPAAMFSDGGASVMWNDPSREKGANAMMTPPRTSPRKEKYNPYTYQPNDAEDDIVLSPKSYNGTPPKTNTPPESEIDKFTANNSTTAVTPRTSYSGKLEPGFIEKVEDIAGKLGIDPNILMKIMQHETGGTFDPKAINPDGHHVGLIQFDTYKTAPGLGTSKQKLLNMTQLQQLDYVYKYYVQVGVEPGMDSAEIYMLTFLPWSRGRADNTIIGRENDSSELGHTGLSKKSLWKANPPFRKWAQSKGQDYYTKGDVIDYYRHYKPT
jgi:hypothetical protein